MDWEPTLVNYLRSITGCDSVPLGYIIRRNKLPNHTIRIDVLHMYVLVVTLTGESCLVESSKMYINATKFIPGNY